MKLLLLLFLIYFLNFSYKWLKHFWSRATSIEDGRTINNILDVYKKIFKNFLAYNF